MARARNQRKKRGKAARFFLLAFLALLIAGFIARHEIPFLLKHSNRTAAPAHGAAASEPDLAGARESVQLPIAPGRPEVTKQLAAGSKAAPRNPVSEQLTGAERRQLDDLIKERSR